MHAATQLFGRQSRRKLSMLALGLAIVLCAAVISLNSADAQDSPPPHRFFGFAGDVTIDGVALTEGTVIVAMIDGAEASRGTVSSTGSWFLDIPISDKKENPCNVSLVIGGIAVQGTWDKCPMRVQLALSSPPDDDADLLENGSSDDMMEDTDSMADEDDSDNMQEDGSDDMLEDESEDMMEDDSDDMMEDESDSMESDDDTMEDDERTEAVTPTVPDDDADLLENGSSDDMMEDTDSMADEDDSDNMQEDGSDDMMEDDSDDMMEDGSDDMLEDESEDMMEDDSDDMMEDDSDSMESDDDMMEDDEDVMMEDDEQTEAVTPTVPGTGTGGLLSNDDTNRWPVAVAITALLTFGVAALSLLISRRTDGVS